MRAREARERCKQSLRDRSEDQNAARNKGSEDRAQEVSNGSKDSIGYWTRGYLCDILTKTLYTFCLYPETLCEAEFKSIWKRKFQGSSAFRQPHVDRWLLLAVYANCEQEVEQKDLENLGVWSEVHIELGPMKGCSLQGLGTLKRSQVHCSWTIGKMLWGISGTGQTPPAAGSRV